MAIDTKRINEMKSLVLLAKDKGKTVNASEAFKKYSPEGKWSKDKDGNIVVKGV